MLSSHKRNSGKRQNNSTELRPPWKKRLGNEKSEKYERYHSKRLIQETQRLQCAFSSASRLNNSSVQPNIPRPANC